MYNVLKFLLVIRLLAAKFGGGVVYNDHNKRKIKFSTLYSPSFEY